MFLASNIFEKDIAGIEPKEVPSLLVSAIVSAQTTFLKELISHLEFEKSLLIQRRISEKIFEDANSSHILEEIFEQKGKEYKESYYGKIELFDSLVCELLFLRDYQSFEAFIGNIYACVCYFFPRFLTASPDDTRLSQLNIDDLFSSSSILQARRTIVESKVKDQLQGSNIKDVLKSFDRKFGFKLGLDPAVLNELLMHSMERNLIVHNSGIVNSIYIALLQRNKIKSNYLIGQKIIINDERVNSARELYQRVIENVSEAFKGNSKQIYMYYQGKYGTYP